MLEIIDGIYSVGVQNPTLKVFDIIMKTPHGTSYNAYLIKGQDKSALVETAQEGFLDQYLHNIEEIMPFADLDYLVINHTEPDHVGIIPTLLKKNSKLQVIGTASAINFVGQVINQPFNSRIVKAGDSLDLGDRSLTFHPMPNLHWPDTMFSQDSKTGALFTCDFLGAHYSFPPMLVSLVPDKAAYMEAVRQYYLDIMAPFARPFVENGLKAVRKLKPSMVLTGHGAVLDDYIDEVCDAYEMLQRQPEKSNKSVAMVYVSAYGYTGMLAQDIKEELKLAGLSVNLIELHEDNHAQALAAIEHADGVLFGSPTFLGDMLQPIGELLAAIHPYLLKGKLCSAFGSYGWSGEAISFIKARLDQLKAPTMDGYRVRLRPGGEDLEGARAFARSFAQALQ